MSDLKEFLARNLNDHEESARGIKQNTFFTWNENHIASAIDMALAFLYSLIPQEFGEIKEITLSEAECVVTFCDVCPKFLDIVDIVVDGESCRTLRKRRKLDDDTEWNDLLSMLSTSCFNTLGVEERDPDDYYYYEVLDSSSCTVKFEDVLPKGTIIKYMCSVPPEFEDFETDPKMTEYKCIVAEYAMFWLYRTDSESVSNLERAKYHFEALQFLVQTKLAIEASLIDDGYTFGHKKSGAMVVGSTG